MTVHDRLILSTIKPCGSSLGDESIAFCRNLFAGGAGRLSTQCGPSQGPASALTPRPQSDPDRPRAAPLAVEYFDALVGVPPQGSSEMQTTPPPTPVVEVAQPAPANQAAPVTVSQQTDNAIIASSDRPMFLVKAGHTEQATLRYILYVVNTTTVLRSGTTPGPDRVRWSYTPYIQRSLCFTSITGLFACSAAETIPLEEKSEGEASLTSPASPGASAPGTPAAGAQAAGSPAPISSQTSGELPAEPSAADVALSKLSERLRQTATAQFDEDSRLRVDALLKAAGVRVLPIPVAARRRG